MWHPPDRLDRNYSKPLWDEMRARAGVMAGDGRSSDDHETDIAEWAWRTIDMMYPQPVQCFQSQKSLNFSDPRRSTASRCGRITKPMIHSISHVAT